MNSNSRKKEGGARFGADQPTPEISHRRAETILIGVLWLIITLALQPLLAALEGLANPLPSVALALGHGLKAALAS